MQQPSKGHGTDDRSRLLVSANALLAKGDYKGAEKLCQMLLVDRPGFPPAQHILSMIAMKRGRLDLAIDYLRIACRTPNVPASYFSNLAEMLRLKGRLQEGEAAARRAVAIDGTQSGAWANLGIILQESGKHAESLKCLSQALALAPDNPSVHNNIANTYVRLGEFSEAEKHWQQAIALRSDYAEVLSNLCNLYKILGRYPEAIAFGERALKINPRLPDAYVNLAAIALEQWQYGTAYRLLSSLIRFAPNHVPGLVSMAQVLIRLERSQEALQVAERAVRLAPGSADAFEAQGRALLAQGRLEDAVASFDAAIALPSNSTERTMIYRAAALLEHGQLERAREGFEATLKRFPGSASALQNLARVKTFSAGDPLIAEMKSILGKVEGGSKGDEIALHFGLGKALMDAKEDAEAFHHFEAGNRMKRALVNYDGKATAKWMESIAEAFTPALMQRLAGQGFGSRMPVFVIGMPRSGTSLIEQILASHPEVQGAGELKILSELITRIGGLPQAVGRFSPELLTRVGSDYRSALARLSQGRPHVVDKMPVNFLHAGFIHLILPQAKIIHSRRNPVDTCLSCYTSLFSDALGFAYDLKELGEFHSAYQKLMAHWASVLPPSCFLEVDYEAVVEDAERETRRMLDFLELPWDEACLEFHRNQRPVRTASVTQVRKPIYRTSSGKWRNYAAHLGPLLASLEMP